MSGSDSDDSDRDDDLTCEFKGSGPSQVNVAKLRRERKKIIATAAANAPPATPPVSRTLEELKRASRLKRSNMRSARSTGNKPSNGLSVRIEEATNNTILRVLDDDELTVEQKMRLTKRIAGLVNAKPTQRPVNVKGTLQSVVNDL